MTPFGQKLRALRQAHGISQKDLAARLDISAAYLSALEHGRRGRPTSRLIDQICAVFDIIWDDADELRRLGRLSHPKITIDTAGLNPDATQAANLLARDIHKLKPEQLKQILRILAEKP